jgi:5'-methylthioadenosine phosphorylase
MKLGVIGGTGLQELFTAEEEMEIKTLYGKPSSPLMRRSNVYFITRHGTGRAIPSHMVNHRANLWAMKEAGIKYVIGISSAGVLNVKIKPGSIVIPHDYINLAFSPLTYFDDEIKHITPGFSEELRQVVISCGDVIPRGVYAQSRGPRLETKAEIAMVKQFADLVGMTAASEATLAKELCLEYACIASADNYAHGLVDEELRIEDVIERAKKNAGKIRKLLKKVAKRP